MPQAKLFTREKSRKTSIFDKKIAYKKSMSFPEHDVNTKVVDTDKIYLNMQYGTNLMTQTRENGRKLQKNKNGPNLKIRFFGVACLFLAQKLSNIFFLQNWPQSNPEKYGFCLKKFCRL